MSENQKSACILHSRFCGNSLSRATIKRQYLVLLMCRNKLRWCAWCCAFAAHFQFIVVIISSFNNTNS